MKRVPLQQFAHLTCHKRPVNGFRHSLLGLVRDCSVPPPPRSSRPVQCKMHAVCTVYTFLLKLKGVF